MKSYTDIEQSRKLAEILPIESADMYWDYDVQKHEDYPMIMDDQFDDLCTPAWSLAALLGALPKNPNIGRPSLESNYKEYYWIQYYDEFMKPNNYITECFNNPVDACYELILKLHELNLL